MSAPAPAQSSALSSASVAEGAVSAAACPLCGGDNACAMAAPEDSGAGECWCFAARIPPETLERIPEEERSRRCVCACCAGAVAPSDPTG